MSTRIRTVKPAWLDDVKIAESSLAARVLSIALIVMSDDYGNGRLSKAVHARVFPDDPGLFTDAFEELVEKGYVYSYVVESQEYYHIVHWDRHQRVDKPGKPGVPGPNLSELNGSRDSRETVANVREDAGKVPGSLATDWNGKEWKGEDPPNPQTGLEKASEQPLAPRPLSDPELLTTFRSALAAAGFGNKHIGGSAWRDLSAQWGTWTPGMAEQERHDLLRRSVARWAESGEPKTARYPVSIFLAWAGEQEGIGRPKPNLPEHRPLVGTYQLTDEDRAAQVSTGAALLELLEQA